MPHKDGLSISEARRIALAAQLFAGPRTPPRSVAKIGEAVRRLGAVQIDSVNVLVRSHYLPLFSRRGAYARELLDSAAYDPARRTLFEYWGHEASLLPLELYPLLRWRMQRARSGIGMWKGVQRRAQELGGAVDEALAQIRERGPLGASELTNAGRSKGGWWGWSDGKVIVEWLFWTGQVTTATRRNFERLYDLTERVLPQSVLGAAIPADEDAQRELMLMAARAHGVATLRDLRDYFRLPTADAAARLRELIEAGQLQPVSVEGWKQQAYLASAAQCPRGIDACALLSPFDSLIWERERTERLFGFCFRLEIYTPVHKREHGYYVLPLLLGDRLVARVDLKSDRQRRALQVRGGSAEEGIAARKISAPLLQELAALAAWLDLERVSIVGRKGELMRELRRCLKARSAR